MLLLPAQLVEEMQTPTGTRSAPWQSPTATTDDPRPHHATGSSTTAGRRQADVLISIAPSIQPESSTAVTCPEAESR